MEEAARGHQTIEKVMAAPDDAKRIADLDFLYICEHAFVDGEGRPCVIGIIDRLTPKTDFPIWFSRLTIALRLRAAPGTTFTVKVQFGPPGDIMRHGHFSVTTGPNGTVMVPFNMVQVRFDTDGDYEARVIVDDEILVPVRTIKVLPMSVTSPQL